MILNKAAEITSLFGIKATKTSGKTKIVVYKTEVLDLKVTQLQVMAKNVAGTLKFG